MTIPATEYDPEFWRGMVARMGASLHRYGPVADAYPHKVDALASMRQRLGRYAHDGNREWLLDAANFLMIEWMHPSHPQAHYDPQDSESSPGRRMHDGATSTLTNEQL